MRKSGRESGSQAEKQARTYLESRGLKMLSANYHCRRGEIDLIMREGKTLVFIEVRQRSSDRFGSATESVTRAKQNRIILAASHYLQNHYRGTPPACRFDVLGITGQAEKKYEWIKDAFQPTG